MPANHKRVLKVRKQRSKATMKSLKNDAKTAKGCLSASVGCLLAPFAAFMPKKKKRKK